MYSKTYCKLLNEKFLIDIFSKVVEQWVSRRFGLVGWTTGKEVLDESALAEESQRGSVDEVGRWVRGWSSGSNLIHQC